MDQQNVQLEFEKQWNEICKMEEEISKNNGEIKKEINIEEIKMKEDMDRKKKRMLDKIVKGMIEKDEENVKLKKENRALKLEITKMKADLKAVNHKIF